MTDLFKYNDYSLFEFGTKNNVSNDEQFTIYINNNHNNVRFHALILASVNDTTNANDYATYIVNNNITANSSGKATSIQIRLTNKAIGGKRSISKSNNIDYFIFYNLPTMYDKYKFNDDRLFNIVFIGEISSFNVPRDSNYAYFIMPRTFIEDIKYSNIGVMLTYNSTSNILSAYGKYKDSRNDEDGGGDYTGYGKNTAGHDVPAGIICFAINKYAENFKYDNIPIIEVGIATTDTNGDKTVNHSISQPYIILLSVVTDLETKDFYNIRYVSKNDESFSVKASWKDGRNGYDGGGIRVTDFYWGVIKKTS